MIKMGRVFIITMLVLSFSQCSNVFNRLKIFDPAGIIAYIMSGLETDTIAPNDVTGVVKTIGDTEISISWKNPNDADFAGVKIMRGIMETPKSPDEGEQVYSEIGTEYYDRGLVKGRQYYYTLFAFDTHRNFSRGIYVSAVAGVSDLTPPGEVKNLQAQYHTGAVPYIEFTWENPDDADFAGVVIVKKIDGYPETYDEVPYRYYCTNTKFIDDQPVLNNIVYKYRVFTYDKTYNYSTGINAVVLFRTPCEIPGLDLGCCDK
jgi:hypothetical protein